jgi:hypothetical protein
MNRRRNANEKVLQISFVLAHSLMIILITHVNAPRSKNIVRVYSLYERRAHRAKWLGGCISAEYTKGALLRLLRRENRILAQMSAECYTHIRGMPLDLICPACLSPAAVDY